MTKTPQVKSLSSSKEAFEKSVKWVRIQTAIGNQLSTQNLQHWISSGLYKNETNDIDA